MTLPAKHRIAVLHLITVFPKSSGAAENTKLTVNSLNPQEFRPILACPAGSGMLDDVAPHVATVRLRWLRREPSPVADLLALRELVSVIRATGADLVHTHNAKDGVLGRIAAWLCGVPSVHTVHNVSFEASTSRAANGLYAFLERVVARVTDRIIVVSRENMRRYLSKRIGRPEQYRVVYSGLVLARYGRDPRTPGAIRKALGLPGDPGPWIGWFGRFNYQKDPITFVRAAAVVAQRLPGARFIVCGDAPLGKSLESQTRAAVSSLGLSGIVHFLGFRRDLPSIFQAVDLVMHSSRYEGMGRVICEALASGKPVAATAVDGVVEVVESGRRGGILAHPEDPAALAAAAIELLENRELAASVALEGKAWVVDNLSAEAMVANLATVYQDCCGRRS